MNLVLSIILSKEASYKSKLHVNFKIGPLLEIGTKTKIISSFIELKNQFGKYRHKTQFAYKMPLEKLTNCKTRKMQFLNKIVIVLFNIKIL